MATRYILVRANSKPDARKFANLSHRKLSTMNYTNEKVTSVQPDKKSGLAGGVKGYRVGLTKKKVERYKRGSKKNMLKPRFNKGYR